MPKAKDLRGEVFHRLTVTEREGSNKQGNALWRCNCACGNEVIVTGTDLRRQQTKSCGCWATEQLMERNKVHGLSKHPLYTVWVNIIRRCYNSSAPDYSSYGGRGITVCDQWRDSPENFIQDMETTFVEGHQLDRKKNECGYSPNNCRWVTPKKNARNRRSNNIISFEGETRCLTE